MKKVLSIAIVICLAVTMTCSSIMAVEPRYSALECPACGSGNTYAHNSTTYAGIASYSCEHYLFGYDIYDVYNLVTDIYCYDCGVTSYITYDTYEEFVSCGGFGPAI